MKYEERIASRFINSRFRRAPIYEPCGESTPPDFSIGRTAFEVRRLNENFIDKDGHAEGLEAASHSLNRAVFGELGKIPFQPSTGSFFVGLNYARPLQVKPSKIARELAKAAQPHYSAGAKVKRVIGASGVTVQLIPASTALGKAFIPGFEEDGESGAYVSELYETNIQMALDEKIAKTKNIAHKFDHWVLVLVDSISPGIDWANEIGGWTPDLQHFNGVAIINPNGRLAWEWPKNFLMSG